jgi:hypothetical protein
MIPVTEKEVLGVCASVQRMYNLYCMGIGDINPHTVGLLAGF